MASHDHQTLPRRLVTNPLLLVILSLNGFCFHAFFMLTLAQYPPPTDTCVSGHSEICSQPHPSCKNLLVNPRVQSQAVIV